MADVDIVVDSGDLKAAIDLLKDYGISFTKMVNQVQTEGNRLSRASKATASQVEQAWENAQKVLDNNRHEEAARKEQQILKLRGQNWKQFFQQDYMRSGSGGITKTSSLLIAQLEEDAAEEKRILNLRSQNWKQFFQQDFMRNTPASSMGAPTAKNSAFDDMERAAKEAAAATKELDREISALTAKYNPLLAAEQQYLAMKNQIARASDLGVIDIKQEAAALDQLEKEYQALSKGVYLAGSRFNQFGEQAGVAGKSANRFGMYAQQAGYQVGDFAVQLQSGTNAGVAFSQQAAQLAGLIPGVAGAITTFGAIGLGLVIQNLTRSTEEASKLDDVVSDFEKFDDIFKSAGVSLEDSFSVAIDKVRSKYGDLVADISEKTTEGALSRLTSSLNKDFRRGALYDPEGDSDWLGRQLNTIKFSVASLGSGFGIDAGNNYLEELGSNRQKYLSAIEGLDEKIKGLGESAFVTSQQLSEGFAEFYQGLVDSGQMSDELLQRLQTIASEAGIYDQVANLIAQQEEANAKAEEMLQTLQNEATVRELILNYGKDSLPVQQELLRQEHEKQKAAIDTLDITEENKSALYAAADAAYEAESATYSWADAMAQVNNQLQGAVSLISSLGGGMIQRAGINAANAVLDAGGKAVDAEKARRRAIEDATFYQQQDRLIAEGKSSIPVYNMHQSDIELQRAEEDAYLERLEVIRESERGSRKSSGGSGRKGSGGRSGSGRGRLSDAERDAEKATEKLEDFFDQFKKGVEQQERLLGVYGEQREELEKVIEIENRLGDARHLVSQKQIEAMAQEELALERKLQREQEIYNIGSQNVENLLMSIVSGTSSIEDAFRTMLANIIKEVYQNYVAKGAADAVGNFIVGLFSANGNAFGPSGVKMFAKGGVVDSPTLFNYSGGTGMMGEAGPEAIMPLKRNSQGKLGVQVSGGSSGNVSIQQNFHISANGDESVRTIIRQEMPNIASAAKAAVIEGKRRNERGL